MPKKGWYQITKDAGEIYNYGLEADFEPFLAGFETAHYLNGLIGTFLMFKQGATIP